MYDLWNYMTNCTWVCLNGKNLQNEKLTQVKYQFNKWHNFKLSIGRKGKPNIFSGNVPTNHHKLDDISDSAITGDVKLPKGKLKKRVTLLITIYQMKFQILGWKTYSMKAFNLSKRSNWFPNFLNMKKVLMTF